MNGNDVPPLDDVRMIQGTTDPMTKEAVRGNVSSFLRANVVLGCRRLVRRLHPTNRFHAPGQRRKQLHGCGHGGATEDMPREPEGKMRKENEARENGVVG